MAKMDQRKKNVRKKILIAGDIMLDSYHFGRVDRISPEAPVPVFLEAGNEKCVAGGAANVAVNIAAIGIETELCSVVGNDDNGRRLLEILSENGVYTQAVLIDNDKETTTKLRFIGPNNQQILRVDTENVKDVSEKAVHHVLEHIKENIYEYGLILLSDYNKGFLTEKVTQNFILMGKEHNIPVLVDVKDRNLIKYKGATLLKPNKKELSELTGLGVHTKADIVEAAAWLCKKTDCEYVLTTLGSDGMLLVGREGLIRETKSFAKEVFDVTGAGDTSIAYLAVEMFKEKDVKDAMVVANYAAGVQVSKVGTSVVYPYEVYAAMRGKEQFENQKVLNFYDKYGLSVLKRRKASGSKIVFTNGCFDILHAGHVSYLQEAKRLGDILVIGVNSDNSVKRLKGNERPINTMSDRLLVLSALDFVDYLIPFEEDTPAELIAAILPDVLVKGGDYAIEDIVGADLVIKNGGEVKVLSLMKGRSTTIMIQKIQKRQSIGISEENS